VGVVFAYGQTGSGKTHTMNGLMDSLLEDVFRPTVVGEAPRAVSFSYLEMLGTVVTDCLVRTQPKGGVQIGEAIDGRVLTRNLSIHAAANAAELGRLVKVAQSKRSVACTARNDESSRSHGVAIVTLGPPGSKEAPEEAYAPAHGVLYIIDLAGSERAADSTNHSKERMEVCACVCVPFIPSHHLGRGLGACFTLASLRKREVPTHTHTHTHSLSLLACAHTGENPSCGLLFRLSSHGAAAGV